MISMRQLARGAQLAPNLRVLQRSRAFASVSNSPLDKKVEMTNWEKGHYINYKYV
jgi:aconitate hydratase